MATIWILYPYQCPCRWREGHGCSIVWDDDLDCRQFDNRSRDDIDCQWQQQRRRSIREKRTSREESICHIQDRHRSELTVKGVRMSQLTTKSYGWGSRKRKKTWLVYFVVFLSFVFEEACPWSVNQVNWPPSYWSGNNRPRMRLASRPTTPTELLPQSLHWLEWANWNDQRVEWNRNEYRHRLMHCNCSRWRQCWAENSKYTLIVSSHYILLAHGCMNVCSLSYHTQIRRISNSQIHR